MYFIFQNIVFDILPMIVIYSSSYSHYILLKDMCFLVVTHQVSQFNQFQIHCIH